MKVWNKRDTNCPKDVIYVGRPSKWGNPFKLHIESNRLLVISAFRDYAKAKLESDPHWLDELRGRDLVCWCAPLPCHADVLLKLANQETSK
jgi:hypothetical protein